MHNEGRTRISSYILIEIADYVLEINKIKHPFDKGVNARYGVEKWI